MVRTRRLAWTTSAALALAMTASLAAAQPFGDGPGRGRDGPGMMMMGPHVFGPGFDRMCGPGPSGFAGWRADRMAEDLKLTEPQRSAFDAFKAASAKAAETMRANCPTDAPATLPGRMEAMEKRMAAMVTSMATVRPALEAFYATLTDAQKAQLDSRGNRSRFWHWRDRW